MLKNIQKQLNIIYLNNNEHTHMGRAKGSTDILDIAFISPNLAKHDIQFQVGDDLGSDHLPIEISIDTSPPPPPPYTRMHLLTTPLEVLSSADFSGLLSTSDLDKYADFIVTAISTEVNKAIPKAKSLRFESNPISDENIVLINENHRLRRHYSQNKDPAVKTRINQLQKQVKENLR